LLGTALELPSQTQDLNLLCAVHRDDHIQSMFRTSKSAFPKSPKESSYPLSALSMPPIAHGRRASEAGASQLAASTRQEPEQLRPRATVQQKLASTTAYRTSAKPRLKRFNSLNELKLSTEVSRPLDADIFEAKKRFDIEAANFQTRKAIEKFGESSIEAHEHGQNGQEQADGHPDAGKPSK